VIGQGLEVTSLELTKCKFEIQVLLNILTVIPHWTPTRSGLEKYLTNAISVYQEMSKDQKSTLDMCKQWKEGLSTSYRFIRNS
jgi:hypothetical protein